MVGLRRPLGFSNRLHHRREFLQFFSGSQVYRLRRCSVFRKENTEGHFRLGVTFKARMSSVERNAIRRRVREVVRQLGPVLGSFDYNVVVARIERPARVFARSLAEELRLGLTTVQPTAARNRT